MSGWGEKPFLRTFAGPWRVSGPLTVRPATDAARRRVGAPDETAGPSWVADMTDDGPATPSDAQLMARVAAGDQEAFAAVYDRHVRAVYGSVLRYLGDPGAAEDVVQETYLAVWTRPDSYAAGAGSLIGWLLAIARHRAIDRLRAAARRPQLVGLTPSPTDGSQSDIERLLAQGRPVAFAAADDEPADLAERGWVRAVVRTALEGMSEPERRALELAYDDGLSQAEIAERLGWPLGTVKTRTRRGLLRLRAMLESVPDIGPLAASVPMATDWADPNGVRHGPH